MISLEDHKRGKSLKSERPRRFLTELLTEYSERTPLIAGALSDFSGARENLYNESEI